MIEYYSTLNKKKYKKEYQAKDAERQFVDNYFKNIEKEAERARRARKLLVRDAILR